MSGLMTASELREALSLEPIEGFAVWSTAYVNDLPDSAFLYVEDGEKDSDGKTVPRTKRHFPYKDANGKVDLPHLRNALARIPQSNLPDDVKKAATAKAQKILAQQGGSDQQTARLDDADLFFAAAPLTHVDVRDPSANPDNTWTMSGYAAVYNQAAVVRSTRDFRVEYRIAPDAFANVLRTQNLAAGDGVVHFNLNHNMDRVFASTNVPAGQPGSLQLRSDVHGLHYIAKVSRDDPDAVSLAVKLRDGVIGQASVAFICARDQVNVSENDDGSEVALRDILEAGRLIDVCATPQGVFHQASSQLQQYAAGLGYPMSGSHPRHPDGGAIPVIPDLGGQVEQHRPRLSARTEVGRRRFTRKAA